MLILLVVTTVRAVQHLKILTVLIGQICLVQIEISQLTHDLPRMYELKSPSKEINSRTIISPTPGHVLRVQQRLRDGHHTLAILEMSEHYDELSVSLQDIADEVNDLNARVVWTIGVVFGHIQQNSPMVVGFEY